MSAHDEAMIRVRGAREHNLKGVDLDLPRGRLIVFSGVSGSGKSSLAFDTVYAEGQRRLLEALAPRLRSRLDGLPRPDVDLVTGLPPTVGVSAEPARGGARSTIATRTEVQDLLRALWAHRSVAACPVCGRELPVHTSDAVAALLSAEPEGTRLTLMAPVARGRAGGLGELFDEMRRLGFARARVDGALVRLDEPPVVDARRPHDVDLVIDRIKVGPGRAERVGEAAGVAFGAGKGRMIAEVARDDGATEERFFADHPTCPEGHVALPRPTPALFSFNTSEGACATCGGLGRPAGTEPDAPACAACGGARLSESARAFRVGGMPLGELLALPARAARDCLLALPPDPATDPLRAEAARRVGLLIELGLGYLPLGRGGDAISLGEARRLHLASQASGDLSGVLYVLDEPSSGLGAESAAVRALVRRLIAAGNTALVVTHDQALIDEADLVVEFGPGAGAEGGGVLYVGPPGDLAKTDTPTGRARSGRLARVGARARPPKGSIVVRGARGRNLGGPGGAGLDARFPLGCLVVVSGPSGSGKTALVEGTLGRALARQLYKAGPSPLPHDALEGASGVRRLVRLSQAPVGRSARSCTATVSGVWGPIRRLLAETREARVAGMGPEAFSFNRPGGRCEACEGTGTRVVRLHLLPDLLAPCERCEGRRFGPAALAVRYRGKDVSELLGMSVSNARRLFAAQPSIEPHLRALELAGLGYLELGQPTTTLSGGESERVRLARELGKPGEASGSLYLLDAPSTGLHPADLAVVLELLQDLVDQGGSVFAVDNDPDLVAAADALLVLGPGAGPEGGRLVYEGSPVKA